MIVHLDADAFFASVEQEAIGVPYLYHYRDEA
jgi:nucleotidyltransferase/DNA polymerase involved in DNA repair